VDIDPSGLVSIASSEQAAADKAIEYIENLIQEAKIGTIYLGKVKKIVDF
jgi:polyribonucleotide nucleotidyltransferase